MSQSLKKHIDRFISRDITADNFADSYMMKWKAERDSNLLVQDDENLSELLSSVFCLSDMYNPDDDREEYEFSDEQLWDEISKLMANYTKK
ncbi:colicin immunity domain-containing protein [Lelliottia sp. V89_10]|uniref:colicin immunity domain-containing protein n=1 Tax=Lelliottia wanjuensis TaxID=3050585 RepID=UPI00249ED941|nr:MULTISPECIES: colicin immunity domain-containing protein [unclassified Lelliottia]MDI3359366.1 colicin immunity domain-containing protein [Lelliottia sp. V89_13]MDK9549952.1 colicin immunity domain-containing protein [Lelliottia sp. V89_5]MDK9596384.1 colicin immunity domain-containing protein [Lelliottia sp. V89_10]